MNTSCQARNPLVESSHRSTYSFKRVGSSRASLISSAPPPSLPHSRFQFRAHLLESCTEAKPVGDLKSFDFNFSFAWQRFQVFPFGREKRKVRTTRREMTFSIYLHCFAMPFGSSLNQRGSCMLSSPRLDLLYLRNRGGKELLQRRRLVFLSPFLPFASSFIQDLYLRYSEPSLETVTAVSQRQATVRRRYQVVVENRARTLAA